MIISIKLNSHLKFTLSLNLEETQQKII